MPQTNRPLPDECVAVAEGVELALWRAGPAVAAADRAPFLLVHGLASNAHLWDGVAEALAGQGHASVAVDLRGHGRSSKPDGPYDVETVAADVAALVPQLGWTTPAVLAGQSYGAIVALRVARLLGSSVAAVACVDGGHIDLRRRFPTWEACAARLAPPRSAGTKAADMEAYMRRAHPDWPATGIAGALACFEQRDDGTVAPWLTFERHMAVLRGLWEADTVALREATTQRTLLLTADDATAGKRDDVDRAAAQLPDAEVAWIRGDHDLHAQHPQAVADALVDLARS